MKTPSMYRLLLFVTLLMTARAVYCQATTPRDKTRDRMTTLLARVGPEVKVAFEPSSKNPYVFIGMMREGLKNCDSMEIVIRVTTSDTLAFRIYPHYKGAYVNVDKAKNTMQLLRKIAQLNDSTFLFWGADETGDVFTGYTFTLESGFPDEAIKIVLSSIKNSDQFVGDMRPSIDGTSAP
jgi:hypothetical protein